MTAHFTKTEKLILNRVQRDIPLSPDPWEGLAAELGLDEEELIASIRALKEAQIIRGVSAIFEASALGYDSSLVAVSVPGGAEADRAAGIISAHPGVSHNYLRAHHYNIWFTLAVPPGRSIDAHARALALQCGAEDYLVLRNERLFKIGVQLAVGDEESEPVSRTERAESGPAVLTGEEVRAVVLLQRDLPTVRGPFAVLARELGIAIDPDRAARIGEALKKRGVMRRYAAVLRHQNAGYRANAMTAWKVPPEREDELVPVFARSPHITHLYRRTVFPGRWEHPLFAMIHAKSDKDLDGIIGTLAGMSGIRDHLVLRSLKEYKKKRVVYYSPEFEEWEARHLR